MAGKFLSLDEAAQRLGVSAEAIQRLVDRKQLYPLRDGNTLKFKPDEIERYAADAEAGRSASGSGIALDIELDGPGLPESPGGGASAASGSGGLVAAGADDELALAADELLLDVPLVDEEPRTQPLDGADIEASGTSGLTGSGGPALSASGGSLAELSLGEDIVDSPPAAEPPKKDIPAEPITGTLPIDLSGIESLSGGSNATGSNVKGSGPSAIELSGMRSNVGSALSGVMEGGLSLEDSDVRKSGILSGEDFDDDMQSAIKASGAASGTAQSGMEGDDFQTFNPVGEDEENGSDIVADESGTVGSSFLEDDGSTSGFLGDESVADIAGGAASESDVDPGASLVRDTTFSVWQICGLICCALLMLTGGFVMYDLIRTLGTPEDLSLSSPLIAPMADLFGWRR